MEPRGVSLVGPLRGRPSRPPFPPGLFDFCGNVEKSEHVVRQRRAADLAARRGRVPTKWGPGSLRQTGYPGLSTQTVAPEMQKYTQAIRAMRIDMIYLPISTYLPVCLSNTILYPSLCL